MDHINNKLVPIIADEMSKLISDFQKRDGFKFDESNRDILSQQEKYLVDVHKNITKISGLVEDLDKIHVFMRRYPSKKFYEENGIDNVKYTVYHLEVWLHKVATILDVMKLLINEVYELGNQPKDCTWNRLKLDQYFQKSLAYEIIEEFFSDISDIIDARHLNTHRAEFHDSEKERIEMYLDLYHLNRQLDKEPGNFTLDTMPEIILNWQARNYRRDKIKMVIKSKLLIEKYLKRFYDSMTQEFLNRYKG